MAILGRMVIPLVARMVEVALAGWLALAAFYVVRQMAVGRIVMTGMLQERGAPGPKLDRLQMFFATLAVAAFYTVAALRAPMGGAMPDVPRSVLYVLFGSHALYLSGHAVRRARHKRRHKR